MRIESKLCFISDAKAVVKVKGWVNEKLIGSSLAEGATVELAEDNAIIRLKNRQKIENKDDDTESTYKTNESNLSINQNINNISRQNDNVKPINYEPDDWSNELIAIDSEINRLKWSRKDENSFLEKNLGFNSRNKITKYSDIIDYLNKLKTINNEDPSKPNKSNINNLLAESDRILKHLSWDNNKGREFLQKEFNVLARKDLTEKQLTSFVSMLKSIRNQDSIN